MYYNNKLAISDSKTKTTCSFIHTITNNKKNGNSILIMKVDGRITTYYQSRADKFTHASVAENIINITSMTVHII